MNDNTKQTLANIIAMTLAVVSVIPMFMSPLIIAIGIKALLALMFGIHISYFRIAIVYLVGTNIVELSDYMMSKKNDYSPLVKLVQMFIVKPIIIGVLFAIMMSTLFVKMDMYPAIIVIITLHPFTGVLMYEYSKVFKRIIAKLKHFLWLEYRG